MPRGSVSVALISTAQTVPRTVYLLTTTRATTGVIARLDRRDVDLAGRILTATAEHVCNTYVTLHLQIYDC